MRLIPLTFFAAVAAGASAQTLTWFNDDAAFNAALTGEFAVAQGRVGNNALNGTYELSLSANTNSVSGTEQAQGTWTNGLATPFSLEFDAGTDLLTFKQLGTTLTFTMTDSINGIGIRARAGQAVNVTRETLLSDLKLNGNALPDVLADDTTIAKTLLVTGWNTGSNWSLTGKTTFSWSGDAPTNSNSAYQIKMVEAVPEPFTLSLLGLGLAGAIARRRAARK